MGKLWKGKRIACWKKSSLMETAALSKTLETNSILSQLTAQWDLLYYFVLIKFGDLIITVSNQLMDNLCHHMSLNWSDIQIYTHVSRIRDMDNDYWCLKNIHVFMWMLLSYY
jgi:hypothetical protein